MEYLAAPFKVSRIGLGTWAIGGWMWGGSDEAEAIKTIHAALDRGINLIDTAPVYGFGRSEEIVGRALAEDGRRKQAVIATKVGLAWKDGKPYRNASKTRIVQEAEDSLRRLQTDVIDIYQVHWPDPKRDRGNRGRNGGALSRRQNPGDRRKQLSVRRRWTRFAPWLRCTPCSRLTICSSAASSIRYCHMPATTALRRWSMDRSAAGCSPGA